MKNSLYCIYDESFNHEFSVCAIRIYLPTGDSFVNFNVAHSVRDNRVCDTWRLSRASIFDGEMQNEELLGPSAEWDMALSIKGRDDFIGGELHGDEVFTSMRIFIDERERDAESITELTEFSTLRIQVESVGYDPDDHKTEALRHFKEYTFTKRGVSLEQRVEWLNDYELDACYLAMMPPYKALTDHYYTDVDGEAKEICGSFNVVGCKSAVLFGKESGLYFSMAIPKYPSYKSGNIFLVTDNSGNPYNKMYFRVCCGEKVQAGETWESVTEYSIEKR